MKTRALPRRPPPASAAVLLLAGALGSAACDAPSARAAAQGRTSDSAVTAATLPTAVAAAADTAREARWDRADRGRIKGRDDAPVWLVVISDFQCPYCKRWHEETEPQIQRHYVTTGKVRVAYLNLPISSHRNAGPAHEAAMCAAEQDRFWPVADALFLTQDDWKARRDAAAYFDSLAGTLPLDHARLRACIAGRDLRALIKADVDRATRIGVGSTPTFLVGSQVLIGAQPYEAFRRALDDAMAAARTAGR